MAALDFGSVPDYLPAFTILGGVIIGVREVRRQRVESRELARRQIESAEQEALAQELAAAQVAGTLQLPEIGNGSRSLQIEFTNHGPYPVFDLEAELVYSGAEEWPERLRRLRISCTLLPAGGRVWDGANAEDLPQAQYDQSDFDWSVTFRDWRGVRWRRGRAGVPEKIGG
jgi:hypothetical protein